MSIFIVALPVLAVIVVANLVVYRGHEGSRLAFNILLFLLNGLLVIAGIGLPYLPLDTLNLPDMGLQLLNSGLGSTTLIGMGLWGMLASLKPVRQTLGRIFPALDPESAVHTLALVMTGYLLGNAALSMAPGALDALAGAGLEVSMVDVLAQQFLFVLGAFAGVGLFIRRDSTALNQRLGLMKPTGKQIWTGIRWMIFFVFLQGCISVTWALFDSAQVEQLSGINEALLGNFDTVGEWFLLAAAAGLGEEILFRGALQPILGLIPTSFIFAISHVQYGLTPATLTIFLFSLVLGIIRTRSNTTVAILVHAGYNFILGLMSLLAVYLQSITP